MGGVILGAAGRQLHGGFLAGDEFAQSSDLCIALLCGFAQFRQGLTGRSKLLLVVGAFLGGLVKCDARIGHGLGLCRGLRFQFLGSFDEHAGILTEVGDDLAGE